LCAQNTNPNPDTTAMVLKVLPETIKMTNLINFIFLAPADIKIKSPTTGIQDAKNTALQPNFSRSLLSLFFCSTFFCSFFFLNFVSSLFPPYPIK